MMKIAILGSTGSIGITTLSIIRENKKNFKIELLTANQNTELLFKQAKEFNVKNVIFKKDFKNQKWINKFKKNKINIYDNFQIFNKIFNKKIDYALSAIMGLDGLFPTLNIIKYTKKIAIANKESIICGWNLIKNELFKNNTKFIPIDSEHFSIHELIKDNKKLSIKKVIITASGGPFLKKKLNKIKLADALKHPTWKMGKKITIDSATLMNKVFEVIEAKKIFNLNMKNIDILINSNSYLHALIIFNNGTTKLLVHETDMKIPIFNSIYDNNVYSQKFKTKDLNIKKINNLNLLKPNTKKFKLLKLLKLIPKHDSLFETVLISINDELVSMFLNKKIDYNKLSFYLMKIIKFKIFKKYCRIKPNSIKQIFEIRNISKEIVNKYVEKTI